MTEKEAYIRGKVYGYAVTRIMAKTRDQKPKRQEPNMQLACMRPKTSMAQILQRAFQLRLPQDFHDRVGEMLNEIDHTDIECVGGVEKVPPLPVQGSWQLGYFAGKTLGHEDERNHDRDTL